MKNNILKKVSLQRIIGVAVVIFAIIGFISTIVGVVSGVRSLLNNDDEKRSYEAFLRPVVMFDPAPFSNPQNADQDFILKASMWSVLMGENLDNYAMDDIGFRVVPASDLDVEASKLFGTEVILTHRTFDDLSFSYLYDGEIKAYHVPVEPRSSYTPLVEEIKTEGDSIFLKVGYISPDNIIFFSADEDYEITPDKYLVYELNANSENQYIKSIQFITEGSIFYEE